MRITKAVALSIAFSEVVRKWLKPSELAEVRKRNILNKNTEHEDCCASHDFIDANMAMDEAFRKMFKDKKNGFSTQADMDLINKAWTLSKDAGFKNRLCKVCESEMTDSDVCCGKCQYA